jgi:hypothetical protein
MFRRRMSRKERFMAAVAGLLGRRRTTRVAVGAATGVAAATALSAGVTALRERQDDGAS